MNEPFARLPIGSVLKLSDTHWVERTSKTRYVGSYVNLVGGEVAKPFTSLKSAIESTNANNADMASQGRAVG